MNEILVSILCNTYNHESYIADALESFIMQKTNFKFEILIYDDASTDKTVEIIKQYEEKYPDLINAIYQRENQYSKDVHVWELNNKRALGKYIAICEGDDYWTDPLKLQKQVDFLECNSDYSLCVHGASAVNTGTKKIMYYVTPSDISREFSKEEVIMGGGGLFATNSMVYRKKGSEEKPSFYKNAPIGDYPLTIFLSLIGKVYYIEDCMSVYRIAVPGSWTSTEYSNIEKKMKHFKSIEKMLEEVDAFTDHAYSTVIYKTIQKHKFQLYLAQEKFEEIEKNNLQEFYQELKSKEKIKYTLKKYSPNMVRFLKEVRKVFS